MGGKEEERKTEMSKIERNRMEEMKRGEGGLGRWQADVKHSRG